MYIKYLSLSRLLLSKQIRILLRILVHTAALLSLSRVLGRFLRKMTMRFSFPPDLLSSALSLSLCATPETKVQFRRRGRSPSSRERDDAVLRVTFKKCKTHHRFFLLNFFLFFFNPGALSLCVIYYGLKRHCENTHRAELMSRK